MNKPHDPTFPCSRCYWGDRCNQYDGGKCEYYDPLGTDVPVDQLGTIKDRVFFYAQWNQYLEYIEGGDKINDPALRRYGVRRVN